ncbi:MAG: hypothetical protein WA840_09130 [Caulobacteraceae bacterium]
MTDTQTRSGLIERMDVAIRAVKHVGREPLRFCLSPKDTQELEDIADTLITTRDGQRRQPAYRDIPIHAVSAPVSNLTTTMPGAPGRSHFAF